MAIDKDIFSSLKFRLTIENYCQTLGWSIYSIDNKVATLRFNMKSGNTQTLFIIKFDSTLEFSCPTGFKFNNIADIPHSLSTLLLMENKKYKWGFWCLEQINNKQVFSIMHNAEMSLIDINYFYKVVIQLVEECEKFEQVLESL